MLNRSMIDVTTEQARRYMGMAIQMKENILITGAPGIGKSQLFEAVCKDIGYDSMILHPAISDPVDFKGIPFVSERGAEYLLDEHLTKLLNTKQPLAVLIDDLGQAAGAVQAACFPAGSQVCTPYGMSNIEDITESTEVIADDGRTYEVIDNFVRQYDGDMFTIKAASILPISATEEHPFLVIDERKKTPSSETHSTPAWKQAKDIVKGNYIGVPIIRAFTDIDSILINKSGEISRTITINNDFARFLGYYIGNGCFVQHPSVQRVEITLNAAHVDKIDDLTGLFERLFATRIFTRRDGNCIKIGIHDKHLGTFLKKHCGDNAYCKKVPSFILGHIDERLVVELLKGYLATDGAIARDKDAVRGVQYRTSSLTLALQVQQLFARLGVLAGIKECSSGMTVIKGKEYDCAKSYAINCYNNAICSLLGVETTKKREVIWAFIYDNTIWTQVRAVSSSRFQGPVYNIEVDERHTYTVNNCIVHNCMQFLEARQLNGKKVSDLVSFVSATNRRRDGSGVGGLFEALKTRFRPILNLEPDVDSWVHWAIDNDMPVELIMFLRWRPNLLNDPKPNKEIVNSACPRTIAAVGRWMKQGIVDAPIVAGCCGDAWAAEFLAFLKVWSKLPDIHKVMQDPANAPVPNGNEPSVMYALSGAISKVMNHDNVTQLMTYVARMPSEYQTLVVKDATRRDETIGETKAMTAWKIKNFNLM